MPSYKVLLVDDDRFVLDALTIYLKSEPDLEVIATAAHGIEALEVLANTHCDVVVSDIEMPLMDGRQLLTEVQKLPQPPAFIAMTAFSTDETLLEMLSNGAAAYIVKSDRAQDIRDIIRVAVSGGTALSPLAMTRLRSMLPKTTQIPEQLSPLQQRVMKLVCEGASNREIMKTTNLTMAVVKKTVSQLLDIFKVSSRTQLVAQIYRTERA
ncbi:response regulator transcription factor [Corynebacterium crudilactis]|uniref:Response regulatory domain-containing protein n=1 Tax=Corynebacterium crudilactis TaxID=1652495 RepID=A0A172QQG8_9CORY|nr:response regulator transcription factor [Corynebacterium crudilactis]ANE02934.1 hypothetical protein ccrud_00990 [Corynebacterium crudilactis]